MEEARQQKEQNSEKFWTMKKQGNEEKWNKKTIMFIGEGCVNHTIFFFEGCVIEIM